MSEQRLIDANELTLEICKRKGCFGTGEGNEPFMAWEIEDYIKDAPTVDAWPVVHAHWEYDPNANDWGIGGWCCSKCHFKNDILGISDKLPLPIKLYAGVRYCAQCGAKMDEVV